jgi:hypothetical protein
MHVVDVGSFVKQAMVVERKKALANGDDGKRGWMCIGFSYGA